VGGAETEELLAYYAEKAGDGAVLMLDDVSAIPDIAEMVERGELEKKELETIWAEVTGDAGKGADETQFVKVWRGIEDLFEYDDFDEEDGEEGKEVKEVDLKDVEGEAVVEDEELKETTILSAVPPTATPDEPAMSFLEGEALSDWVAASKGAATAAKTAVFSRAFIAEVIADGELALSEANDIWAETVGMGVTEADEAAFGRFWYSVDALFEDEDEDEDEDDVAAPVAAPPAAPPVAAAAAAAPAPSAAEEDPLADWEVVSSGGPMASKDAVFGSAFIAELVADGDLEVDEAEEIWGETVGADAVEADEAAFGRFWYAIEDLFEDDDDDGDDEDDDDYDDDYDEAYDLESSSPAALEAYAKAREELVAALAAVPRCGFKADAAAKEAIARLCKELEESAPQRALRGAVRGDDARMAGTWELVYTSSESFDFNQGFTGVARTTPGGGEFESLTQELTATALGGGGGDVSFVETLRIGGGVGGSGGGDEGSGESGGGLTVPLVVNVDGSWEMKRRVNLMSIDQDETVVIDVTPQCLKYGPIEVRFSFFFFLFSTVLIFTFVLFYSYSYSYSYFFSKSPTGARRPRGGGLEVHAGAQLRLHPLPGARRTQHPAERRGPPHHARVGGRVVLVHLPAHLRKERERKKEKPNFEGVREKRERGCAWEQANDGDAMRDLEEKVTGRSDQELKSERGQCLCSLY
jgi:hypothetical protein